MNMGLALDMLIAFTLVWLGVRTLYSRVMFRAVYYFVVFGLVMALAWVRLHAPDIALAEAAIGSGLTGVLLLDAARHFFDPPLTGKPQQNTGLFIQNQVQWISSISSLVLLGVLFYAVWLMPTEAGGVTQLVSENMKVSGVEHPVTAVLLNFRVYDTWLEIGVLLVAVFGVMLFQGDRHLRDVAKLPAAEPVLHWLVRLLFPLLVLVAGYLLWLGKYDAGGAFQAGVVLGSGVVLLWLSGQSSLAEIKGWVLRLSLVLGFMCFTGVALISVLSGRSLLYFSPGQAGLIILLLEATATISIAVIVAALLLGVQERKL